MRVSSSPVFSNPSSGTTHAPPSDVTTPAHETFRNPTTVYGYMPRFPTTNQLLDELTQKKNNQPSSQPPSRNPSLYLPPPEEEHQSPGQIGVSVINEIASKHSPTDEYAFFPNTNDLENNEDPATKILSQFSKVSFTLLTENSNLLHFI